MEAIRVDQLEIIFKERRVDQLEIFMMTQLKVWSWITNKEILPNFTYYQWCMDPMSCPKQIKKK